MKRQAKTPRPPPTREELDHRDPRKATAIVLLLAAGSLVAATLWWARHGGNLLTEAAFHVETIYVYWTLVATPIDRKVWTFIAIALLLMAIVAAMILHRFVWRALFPDLVRLDPRAHAGGRPERVGRLYRIQPFQDDGEVRYRHHYKHGDRWFPLFRFDHVDLPTRAQPLVFGVSILRCGRLERDPTGNRFRRIATNGPYATQPLGTTFRETEVMDDQLRKTSIVGPGPGMNPEVMRRKWQSEPSMIPRLERQSRNLVSRHTHPPDPRIGPDPTEEDEA